MSSFEFRGLCIMMHINILDTQWMYLCRLELCLSKKKLTRKERGSKLLWGVLNSVGCVSWCLYINILDTQIYSEYSLLSWNLWKPLTRKKRGTKLLLGVLNLNDCISRCIGTHLITQGISWCTGHLSAKLDTESGNVGCTGKKGYFSGFIR